MFRKLSLTVLDVYAVRTAPRPMPSCASETARGIARKIVWISVMGQRLVDAIPPHPHTTSSVANGTSRAVVHPLSRCMSLYATPGRQASLSFM